MDKMAIVFWLVVFLILLAIELMTLGLTTVWFAVGALFALLIAFLDGSFIWQMISFVVVSIVVLIFLRPFAVKYINKGTEKTNVEGVIGKTAKVTQTISNIDGKGEVIIDGMNWTARSDEDEEIKENELVTVLRVEGVKVIVKKTNN